MTGLGHIAPYFTFTDFPETGVFIEDAVFHGNVSYWEERRTVAGQEREANGQHVPTWAANLFDKPLGITINWEGSGYMYGN